MSNGLNVRFMRDPVAFLSAYWDINSSSPQHGEGYGISDKGIANLDLSEYSPQTVRVSKADTGLFAFGAETPVTAYYLASRANASRTLNLGADANYFFTDAITGCQFSAHGNTRHALTVVHTNAITTGGATVYDAEAKALRTVGSPITIIYGPRNYQAGLNAGETKENVVATIIGWRRGDGWHFYTKRRLNDPGHRRALDGGAYEL
jgi:hypothetical protein